jgi:hypothetical protein
MSLKKPEKPPQWLKIPLLTSILKFPPRPPAEKTPHPNPGYCVKDLFDTPFPFWYYLGIGI